MLEQFYDCFTGRYFMSSIEKIDSSAGVIRNRVSTGDLLTMNDFWKMIDLEPLDIGYCFVPSNNEEVSVEFSFGGDNVQMLVHGFVADSDAIFSFRPTLKGTECTMVWKEGRGPV